MIEAAAAAAATATSSDWLSMLSISLSMSVHIWCGVRRVGLARVIVYYTMVDCMGCVTLENSS